MGGLGYLEVLEDGSYKGPIDKFIPEELKGEIKDLAGLQPCLLYTSDMNFKADKMLAEAAQIEEETFGRVMDAVRP